jgi:hypothetical protein
VDVSATEAFLTCCPMVSLLYRSPNDPVPPEFTRTHSRIQEIIMKIKKKWRRACMHTQKFPSTQFGLHSFYKEKRKSSDVVNCPSLLFSLIFRYLQNNLDCVKLGRTIFKKGRDILKKRKKRQTKAHLQRKIKTSGKQKKNKQNGKKCPSYSKKIDGLKKKR